MGGLHQDARSLSTEPGDKVAAHNAPLLGVVLRAGIVVDGVNVGAEGT